MENERESDNVDLIVGLQICKNRSKWSNPSKGIRVERSGRKNLGGGNRADECERMDPTRGILPEGSDRRNPSKEIREVRS